MRNSLLSKIRRKLFPSKCQKTYSQCGEDIIAAFAFMKLEISDPYYVDIGAHDPYLFSNTALFYERGCSGICIEPDPYCFNKIKKARKRDTCLPFGISESNSSIPFYVMSARTLNTFSKKEAEHLQRDYGYAIENILEIKTYTINDVLEKYAKRRPNFISLDAEGIDDIILKTFDFSRFAPELFCIETIEFSHDKQQKKNTAIIEYMASEGYSVYADTYINTLFVRW